MTEVMEVVEPKVEAKKKGRPKKEASSVEVICGEREYLSSKGFKFEWLDLLATQYGFNKLEYLHKFKAFRCYRKEKHVDWIDINNVSLLNGGRSIDQILLKHQAVSPKQAVIQYAWR
jgi:hypothetical protein|tara:strand:+ start:852 stop:1202 length:351 start_codon:yes stop_codon:yes gene_type:complete